MILKTDRMNTDLRQKHLLWCCLSTERETVSDRKHIQEKFSVPNLMWKFLKVRIMIHGRSSSDFKSMLNANLNSFGLPRLSFLLELA